MPSAALEKIPVTPDYMLIQVYTCHYCTYQALHKCASIKKTCVQCRSIRHASDVSIERVSDVFLDGRAIFKLVKTILSWEICPAGVVLTLLKANNRGTLRLPLVKPSLGNWRQYHTSSRGQ